jgi:hypothetical protein
MAARTGRGDAREKATAKQEIAVNVPFTAEILLTMVVSVVG